VKISSNSSRARCLSGALVVLLLMIGFFAASGCDLGTYKKRYDGPEPKQVQPKEAKPEDVDPENAEVPNDEVADESA